MQSAEKFLLSIVSDIDDPGYPDRILSEYVDFFGLDRAHLAGLNEKHDINYYGSIGLPELPETYQKYQHHDMWKPANITPDINPFDLRLTIELVDKLAETNPLYDFIKSFYKKVSTIGSIHADLFGIFGFKLGRNFTSDELNLHKIISPAIVSAYYQNRKITGYKEIFNVISQKVFSDKPYAFLDNGFRMIHSCNDFTGYLNAINVNWEAVKAQLAACNPLKIMNAYSFKDSFDLPGISDKARITVEPVINKNNLYYLVKISENENRLQLTPQEQRIHSLIKLGLSNKIIGDMLCISRETVKKHISNLFKKTGAKNRTELSHIKI